MDLVLSPVSHESCLERLGSRGGYRSLDCLILTILVGPSLGANPQTSQLKGGIYLFGQCSTGLVLARARLCFSS